MKWTNHSKLDVYGVKVVGWPEGVPVQNPSTLTVAQNKILLDLLAEGKLHFVRIDGSPVPDSSFAVAQNVGQKEEDAIFEDSIDYSWVAAEGDSNLSVSLVRIVLEPPRSIMLIGVYILGGRWSYVSSLAILVPRPSRT